MKTFAVLAADRRYLDTIPEGYTLAGGVVVNPAGVSWPPYPAPAVKLVEVNRKTRLDFAAEREKGRETLRDTKLRAIKAKGYTESALHEEPDSVVRAVLKSITPADMAQARTDSLAAGNEDPDKPRYLSKAGKVSDKKPKKD